MRLTLQEIYQLRESIGLAAATSFLTLMLAIFALLSVGYSGLWAIAWGSGAVFFSRHAYREAKALRMHYTCIQIAKQPG